MVVDPTLSPFTRARVDTVSPSLMRRLTVFKEATVGSLTLSVTKTPKAGAGVDNTTESWTWSPGFNTTESGKMMRGPLGAMTVESVVPARPDPPPETLTAFTSGEVAVAVTFTVTVMGG